MPDITMCANKDCPVKEGCYRFKAKPDQLQNYASFVYDEQGGCEYHWPLKKEVKNETKD